MAAKTVCAQTGFIRHECPLVRAPVDNADNGFYHTSGARLNNGTRRRKTL